MRRMVLPVCLVVAVAAVYIAALYIGIGRPVEVLAQTTETVLYEGARVIVGDGSAPIENAAILVENGKFTTIGQRGQVQGPSATRVDLTGKTVMPALVNTPFTLTATITSTRLLSAA